MEHHHGKPGIFTNTDLNSTADMGEVQH
jgi:hypothetical protein